MAGQRHGRYLRTPDHDPAANEVQPSGHVFLHPGADHAGRPAQTCAERRGADRADPIDRGVFGHIKLLRMPFKKKRLALAIAVYWFLLAYIVSDMAWWFIDLEMQNRQLTVYQLRELKPDDPQYATRTAAILGEEKKRTAAYVGEGSTFLLLIVLGAIFVYREV